ncbi:MAG: alpha/beta hydrolase [Gammaproteobacteria bacterium]|nr:alpha/beta hydrolase [Gammaproteobacteria bacterium]
MLSSSLLWAAETSEQQTKEAPSRASVTDAFAMLREDLPPLDFERTGDHSSAVAAYFDFYGLDAAQHEHFFGTFRSGQHVLAAHAYRPEAARATVLVMHGFLDHTGTLGSTIQHLLAQGFAVAAFDQPGHGLSSGPRADIGDFADYARVFEDFLRLCRAHMSPPYHVLAHSTGAAIVINHLLSQRDDKFEQVMLIAPLVRSAHWELSTAVSPVVDTFVDQVPRIFRDNSSDEAFLEFVRQDPLQARQTSLNWFSALVDWNQRIQRYPTSERAIVIVQGDADSVVDWEYNLKFLEVKFPNGWVEIIVGGGHQLLNEAPTLRAQVLEIVDTALDSRFNHNRRTIR